MVKYFEFWSGQWKIAGQTKKKVLNSIPNRLECTGIYLLFHQYFLRGIDIRGEVDSQNHLYLLQNKIWKKGFKIHKQSSDGMDCKTPNAPCMGIKYLDSFFWNYVDGPHKYFKNIVEISILIHKINTDINVTRKYYTVLRCTMEFSPKMKVFLFMSSFLALRQWNNLHMKLFQRINSLDFQWHLITTNMYKSHLNTIRLWWRWRATNILLSILFSQIVIFVHRKHF